MDVHNTHDNRVLCTCVTRCSCCVRSLQTKPVTCSPHWPAACPGEKSVRMRWQQSPRRPCSQAGSGPHSPRSTQTPPRRQEGAGESRRLLPAHGLLSAHSLPVGYKAMLTLIVTLRLIGWGNVKTLFPIECWGTLLECRFFHSMTRLGEYVWCKAIQSFPDKWKISYTR